MAYKSPNRPPQPVRFKVTCVNDGDRPNEVPASKWVKKGQRYTVIGYSLMHQQGIVGFLLEEVDLSGCDPYRYFHSSRFAQADVDAFLEDVSEKVNEDELEAA